MSTTVKIPLGAVLKEASDFYDQALSYRLAVPTYMSPKFKGLLYSVYRNPLESCGAKLDNLGYILGNKERWDSELCKLFTLRFLRFFMLRMPSQELNPNALLTSFRSLDTRECRLYLSAYEGVSFSPDYLQNGPTIFLCEPRTLSIKAKARFPNVEKARVSRNRNEYMYKWINLRYKKTTTGLVKLLPFPKFEAVRLPTGRYSSKGLISSLPGEPLKFSICQLSNSLKTFLQATLDFSVSNTPNAIALASANVILDIANLIQRQNVAFEISKDTASDLPLFETPTTDSVRINGFEDLDNVYFMPLAEDVDEDEPIRAYRASQALKFSTNILSPKADYEYDEPIQVCVFQTSDIPSREISKGFVEWDKEPQIEDMEVFEEFDFYNLL